MKHQCNWEYFYLLTSMIKNRLFTFIQHRSSLPIHKCNYLRKSLKEYKKYLTFYCSDWIPGIWFCLTLLSTFAQPYLYIRQNKTCQWLVNLPKLYFKNVMYIFSFIMSFGWIVAMFFIESQVICFDNCLCENSLYLLELFVIVKMKYFIYNEVKLFILSK